MKIFQRIKQFFKLGVEIEQGIYIKTESRETFIATYEGRKVRVCMERLPRNTMIICHSVPEKRAYLPPNDKEPLTEEQYAFVIQAIANHFRKAGCKVELTRTAAAAGPLTVEDLERMFPHYKNSGYKIEKQPDGSIKVSFPETGLHKRVWWGVPLIVVIIIGLFVIMLNSVR